VRDEPLPAVAAVISFIDAINRSDVERLGELMTEEHHYSATPPGRILGYPTMKE
jgi:hypothetical protein